MGNFAKPRGTYFDTDNIISVTIPAGSTLSDGACVQASALNEDKGNDLYDAIVPTANTLDYLAIIAGDEYYQDALGNRIEITNPTNIEYQAGSRVRAYRLPKARRWDISNGAIVGTPVVGQFLIPTANSEDWTVSASVDAAVNYAFIIEKIDVNITYTGLTALKGVVARVVKGD